MLALNITNIKDFTNKLFLGNTFDSFWMRSAQITTYCTFSIDGGLQNDFFDTDELNFLKSKNRTCALWSEVKPICHSVIRGKHTPLQFKIILQLSPRQVLPILSKNVDSSTSDLDVKMFLNIQYKNKTLICTTGVSSASMPFSRNSGIAWDQALYHFFEANQIAFETLQ